MKYNVMKCLSCGNPLEVDESKENCKCEYCGTTMVIERKINIEIVEGNEVSDETPKLKKEEIEDVNKLLRRTAKLEGDANEFEAMALYDEYLKIEPNNPFVLIARALVSLMDSENNDLNIELFEEYFNKGLQAIEDDGMDILDFLMYRFRRYTTPSIYLWQTYAYENLEVIDKREAKKRFANNLLKLFEVQNKINEVVDDTYFDKKMTKSYKNEYKEFKSSIIKFGEQLFEYADIYDLKFKFWDKLNIRDSMYKAKADYKHFVSNNE